ncbi:hypothetical protein [Planococcus halotolerans]|uniref:Uncharacterized protein n=1 Tax=Planococcus halotolerans TaxID=2233542 RepID=A0A365KK08_9BACL|nr:hypothetical protein [Planococcus halotolerans]RAZ73467.1 hypothetical protein DP120_17190 [Planococcus halotolerans]
MIYLREEIEKFFCEKNFEYLEEKKITDTHGKHDYNTSLLVAHVNEILNDQKNSYSIQRVYYPVGNNEAMRYPLFSYFQVMSNFYYKNVKDISKPLLIAIEFLEKVIEVNRNSLKVLIYKETYNLYKETISTYFKENQIIIQDQKSSYEFNHSGKNVTGEYIKFLYSDSNNKFFPIYDFVLMSYENSLTIEAGGILDRFLFIKEKKYNIYQTKMYSDYLVFAKNDLGKEFFEPNKDYIGYYAIQMLRSITIAMLDGVKPSNKNPQAKNLRYWIKYLMIRLTMYNISPFWIIKSLNHVFENLKLCGYSYTEKNYKRVTMIWESEISNLFKDYYKEMMNIYKEDWDELSTVYLDVLNLLSKKNQKEAIMHQQRLSHGYPFEDELQEFKNLTPLLIK